MKKLLGVLILPLLLCNRPLPSESLRKLIPSLEVIKRDAISYVDRKATFPENSSPEWISDITHFYIYYEISLAEAENLNWTLSLENNFLTSGKYPCAIATEINYNGVPYSYEFAISIVASYVVAYVHFPKTLIKNRSWSLAYDGSAVYTLAGVTGRLLRNGSISDFETTFSDFLIENNKNFSLDDKYPELIKQNHEKSLLLYFGNHYGFEDVSLIVGNQILVRFSFYEKEGPLHYTGTHPLKSNVPYEQLSYLISTYDDGNFLVVKVPCELFIATNFQLFLRVSPTNSKMDFTLATFANKDSSNYEDDTSSYDEGSSSYEEDNSSEIPPSTDTTEYVTSSDSMVDSSNVDSTSISEQKKTPIVFDSTYIYVAFGLGGSLILIQLIWLCFRKR